MFYILFFLLLTAFLAYPVYSATIPLTNGVVSSQVDVPETTYQQFELNMTTQGLSGRQQFDVYINMINSVHTMTAYCQWNSAALSSSNFFSYADGTGDLWFSVDLPDSTSRSLFVGVYADNAVFPASTITMEVTVTAHAFPLLLTNSTPLNPANIYQGYYRYFQLILNDSSPFHRNVATNLNLVNSLNTMDGYFKIPTGYPGTFSPPSSVSFEQSMVSNMGDWIHNIFLPATTHFASIDLALFAQNCAGCDEISISDITMTATPITPVALTDSVPSSPQSNIVALEFQYFSIVVSASSAQIDVYVDLFNGLNSVNCYVGIGYMPTDSNFDVSNVGESGDLYLTVDLLSPSTVYFAVKGIDCYLCTQITYDITATIEPFSKTLPLGVLSSSFLPVYENYLRHYTIPLNPPYSGINILQLDIDILNSANTITSYVGFDIVPSDVLYDGRSSPGDIGDIIFQVEMPNDKLNSSNAYLTIHGTDCPGCNSISITGITPTLSTPPIYTLEDQTETIWRDVTTGGYIFYSFDVPDGPSQVDFRVDLAVDTHTVHSTVFYQGSQILTKTDSGDQTFTVDMINGNSSIPLILRLEGISCLPACTQITHDITPYLRPYIRDFSLTDEFTDFNIVSGYYRYFKINITSALPSSLVKVDYDILNLNNDVTIFFARSYLPNATNYDNMTTSDSFEWNFSVGDPWYIALYGDSCPGCTWISMLSFQLILEQPPMFLPFGSQFNPGVDLPQGQFHQYYFTVPLGSTALITKNQLDFDIDLWNPANTMYFYLNFNATANKTSYIYKQDDDEVGDLESSWLLEPGLWYLGVYAKDCYGCWEISYDVSTNVTDVTELTNNTIDSVLAYEHYPRAVITEPIPMDHQVNFVFDFSDALGPSARASICAFTFPNTSGLPLNQSRIIPPLVSMDSVNEDDGPTYCGFYHSEYGDLTLSVPVIEDDTRILIYVTDLYCDVVCDSLQIDITPLIVPMKQIPHSVAVAGSQEIYYNNDTVHEKWMVYYTMDVDPNLQVIARTYYPVIYTTVTDLYIGQDFAPSKYKYSQAATNVSSFSLVFPEYPDRAISIPSYSASKWYIGVLGTSCGGLCSDAPFSLEVITTAVIPDSLKPLDSPDPTDQLTWALLAAAGCVTSLASLISCSCYLKKYRNITGSGDESSGISDDTDLEMDDITKGVVAPHALGPGSNTTFAPHVVIAVIFLIASIVLVVVSLSSIVGPVEPAIHSCGTKMLSSDIWNLDASIMTYTVIENPNWLSGELNSLDIKLFHNGTQIGAGNVSKTVIIPNGDFAVVELVINFDFNFQSAWNMLTDIFNSPSHDFSVLLEWKAKVSSQDFFGFQYSTDLDGEKTLLLTPFTPSNSDPPKQCAVSPKT